MLKSDIYGSAPKVPVSSGALLGHGGQDPALIL